MSSARGSLRLFLLVRGCPVGFSLFQVDSIVVGGCKVAIVVGGFLVRYKLSNLVVFS